MRTVCCIVFAVVLLISSMEGAADAVRVEVLDPSAPHDGHQTHTHDTATGDGHGGHHDNRGQHGHRGWDGRQDTGHEHDPGEPADDPDHEHVCHCGVHAPVLAVSWSIELDHRHDDRDTFAPRRYASRLRPPPLPPPIA